MDLCEGFCVFLTVVKGRNEVLAVMELGLYGMSVLKQYLHAKIFTNL